MKPLDAGTGRLCASFDTGSAAWLSLGAPHARHGFVELSALPPFDESMRGDPDATRRHRLEMTRPEHAFLSVEIDGERPLLKADPSHPSRPRWSGAGLAVEVEAEPDASVIRQLWAFGAGSNPNVRIAARGRVYRPALAELPELDSPVHTGVHTTLVVAGDTVRWEAPDLPGTAMVSVLGCRVDWQRVGDRLVGSMTWPPDAEPRSLMIEAHLGLLPIRGVPTASSKTTRNRLTDRALAYVRGCTVLRVASDERAILTDHRMLPLSWTRDAYWQSLALLAADGQEDRMRVADHLRWLWRRCERPDGRWVRSHHANGRRKDLAFQADQQLYPLVELADYWRLTRTLPDGIDWPASVARAWAAALEEVDPAVGLIASAENAADDPATAPYIGASQILLWYTARRVAEVTLEANLGIDTAGLYATADAVRVAFMEQFDCGPWPYAVDGAGLRVAYHDANDLPVVLAPVWGFCPPSDAGWLATMAFALSDANPGWVTGARSGLGSAHTPGPWTLGDVQAWMHARIVGDGSAAEAALSRLEDVSFADGSLPEAYDANGDDRVRHWFAWPGAALAALRLLDDAGHLHERLATEAPRHR
ncbi:MAG: glycoside hydrolase family 125 protein [Candidatus Limnocylindria bacterium]